jgi:hypothetical protein
MFRTGKLDSAQTLGKQDQFLGPIKKPNGTLVLPKILYGGPLLPVAICRVPSRRLEDHIKDLCVKISAARETELEPALSELKSALHEHAVKLRRLAAEKLTGVEEQPPAERRNEQ